jgi:hypothetical protein
MSSTKTTFFKKKTDYFYTNHIAKFLPNESKISLHQSVEGNKENLLSFYQFREAVALEKNDFEINLYDIEKVVNSLRGTSSEIFFSKQMLTDLLELHKLVRNHMEENDKVADNIYVMF